MHTLSWYELVNGDSWKTDVLHFSIDNYTFLLKRTSYNKTIALKPKVRSGRRRVGFRTVCSVEKPIWMQIGVICWQIITVCVYVCQDSWVMCLISTSNRTVSWLGLQHCYLHIWTKRKECSLHMHVERLQHFKCVRTKQLCLSCGIRSSRFSRMW